jgi:Tfp pilus assembly protein PilX
MTNQANSDYYAARAVEHRRMSETTDEARVALIHAELAARYAELSLELETPSQKQTAAG